MIAAVLVRLGAVGLLLAGPWTDEPAELAGWDADRFQEIADRDGPAWVDQPIEYPPGSVMLLDRLAGDDVVATNRTIVAVSALIELLGVSVLWRMRGGRAAGAFLLLGTPLVPMGLLRLDMTVTVVAMLAALVLVAGDGDTGPQPDKPAEPGGPAPTPSPLARSAMTLFAGLVAVAAMIKIWPGLLVAGAWAVGRRSAAAAAAATTGLAGVAWLVVVGAGLDPLDQILSLRGATGWHVESVPGALTALLGDAEARRELDAFRIGTLDRTLVTAARVAAVAVIAALALTRSRPKTGPITKRLALVMLGSTAALIVTAPLLSPQFLLWLTPWAALIVADPRRAGHEQLIVGLVVAAVILTGATLTSFGPDRVADRLPAALLTLRNLSLLALPVACLVALRRGVPTPAVTGDLRPG